MKVIGIFGPARTGKSTVAEAIMGEVVDNGMSVVKESFAGPLKRVVKKAMGQRGTADDEMLKSRSDPFDFKRNLKVKVLDQFLLENNLPGLFHSEVARARDMGEQPFWAAYRWLMQFFGTDVVRKRDPSFWVRDMDARLIRRKRSECDVVVIDDGRFINEFELVARVWRGYTIGLVSMRFLRNAHESELSAQIVAEMCDAVFMSREGLLDRIAESVRRWVRRYIRDMSEMRSRDESN